ncbi:HNH homing endonuclease [Salmonella phage vB_Sen_H9]|uniref:HNH homing endonuclease n=1 Tax=Salmonella phage vB_Sen_I1 TaxID=2723910 RepID=A0A7L5CBH3_9CAUD|nr:HNH homing endonuclease [Salmonella phage vB_Sen_I1]QJA18020.1 HNH homing endonuclease [Salmonella phage vB_Sen_H9]
MGKYKEMDYDLFNHYFYYDETSKTSLRWKVNKGRVRKDTVAGTYYSQGYYIVRLNKECYLVHRVVWLLLHGEIDSDLMIDHIDRNKLNNKGDNLRQVTQAENNKNRPSQYKKKVN